MLPQRDILAREEVELLAVTRGGLGAASRDRAYARLGTACLARFRGGERLLQLADARLGLDGATAKARELFGHVPDEPL